MNNYIKHIIAVDFDGTIVTHEYPKVGHLIYAAIDTLIKIKELGHTLILLTMRSGDLLEEAINHCREAGLEFDHINENPSQLTWTNSPKVYGTIYIDDAALGCPLQETESSNRPYAKWHGEDGIINLLIKKGIKPQQYN